MLNFMEGYKLINGICQIGAVAAVTTDRISLKHAQKCWIVVSLHENAAGCTLVPMRSVAVGTAGVVLVNPVPIWINLDTDTTDTLVRQADAVNYSVAAGTHVPKMVVFEIDPSSLATEALPNTQDCIYLVTGSLAATDAVSVLFVVSPRYPQATAPSMIVD